MSTTPHNPFRRIATLRSGPPGGFSARRQTASPSRSGPSAQLVVGARGALVGLMLGDRLAEEPPAADVTAVQSVALALAEQLGRRRRPHVATLGRAIADAYVPDPRYDADVHSLLELWEKGVPVVQAAAQLNDQRGLGSDLAAAVWTPAALRHAGDAATLRAQMRRYVVTTHTDPTGIDGAVTFALTVHAALMQQEPLQAAWHAATTPQLRRALATIGQLAKQRTSPGSLCEYLDTGSSAAAAVPTAVYCAATADTFAEALANAIAAVRHDNAVVAMAAAIAGARFGVEAIPPACLRFAPPAAHARLATVARELVEAAWHDRAAPADTLA